MNPRPLSQNADIESGMALCDLLKSECPAYKWYSIGSRAFADWEVQAERTGLSKALYGSIQVGKPRDLGHYFARVSIMGAMIAFCESESATDAVRLAIADTHASLRAFLASVEG